MSVGSRHFAEKRRHPRMPVQLPARVQVGGQLFQAEITDISKGGAFVHGAIPVNIGTEVSVQILGSPPLEIQEEFKRGIRSIVRWVRGTSVTGFGIEFQRLRPDSAPLPRD